MSTEHRPSPGPQSDAGNSPAENLELLERYRAINAAAQAIPAPSVSAEEWGKVWERIRDGMRNNDLEEPAENWIAFEQSVQNSSVPEVNEDEWNGRWSAILHSIRHPAAEESFEVSPEMIGAYLDGELAPDHAELVDASLNAPAGEIDSIARLENVPSVSNEEWDRQWQNIARAIEPSMESTSMEARLTAYHDAELDSDGRAEVEAWLEENPAGRETLRQFERLDALARLDEVPPVTDEEWAGRTRVMAEEGQTQSEIHRPAWVTFGLWAAGVAAGLAAIIWAAGMFQPEPAQTLAWQTRNESSLEEIDASHGDSFVYYSEEADLTIIWQTSD